MLLPKLCCKNQNSLKHNLSKKIEIIRIRENNTYNGEKMNLFATKHEDWMLISFFNKAKFILFMEF